MSRATGDCAFCGVRAPIAENELAVAIFDRHPVNPGHALILTRRHVASFFDTTEDERSALFALLFEVRQRLDRERAPDGYNVGVNVGAAAGQTLTHVHVHLIPRFGGDMENPRGGVRGVIPRRQNY